MPVSVGSGLSPFAGATERANVGGGGLIGRVDAGAAAYVATAVNFDGTNDYLTRGEGLTGAADGKEGIFVCWFNFQGGDGVLQTFVYSEAVRVFISKQTSNKIRCRLLNTSGGIVKLFDSTNTFTAASGWKCLMCSWGATTVQMYIGDTDETASTTNNNDTIDYTDTDWSVGAQLNGSVRINADIADMRLYIDQTLDLSVESNRRKFIDGNGKPVDPDTAGLGTPIVDFKGDVSSWHTNDGSGGGFTENGALTEAASSPSD